MQSRKITVLPQILGVILLCIAHFSFANWQIEAKNLKIGVNDTQLYLQNEGLQDKYEVQITARLQGENQIVYRKNFIQTEVIEVTSLHLNRGTYIFTVDCINLKTGEIETQTINYSCHPLQNGFYASDILLSHLPINHPNEVKPLISKFLSEKKNDLFFHQSIISQEKNLTARAVLYQETQGSEIPEATTYVSVAQINKVLAFGESNHTDFSGSFDRKNLTTGKYLLEILIYSDTKLLTEKTISFTIEWNGWQKIWENLDMYLTDMNYITSADTVKKLLIIQPHSRKQQAVWQVWQHLYPNDYEAQAKSFYQRCMQAHELYPNDEKKRSTLIRYGEPSEKDTIKGKKEIWYYSKWDMTVQF